eukprot:gene6540-biopygen1366
MAGNPVLFVSTVQGGGYRGLYPLSEWVGLAQGGGRGIAFARFGRGVELEARDFGRGVGIGSLGFYRFVPRARAPGAQMMRMEAVSSLALQRVSRGARVCNTQRAFGGSRESVGGPVPCGVGWGRIVLVPWHRAPVAPPFPATALRPLEQREGGTAGQREGQRCAANPVACLTPGGSIAGRARHAKPTQKRVPIALVCALPSPVPHGVTFKVLYSMFPPWRSEPTGRLGALCVLCYVCIEGKDCIQSRPPLAWKVQGSRSAQHWPLQQLFPTQLITGFAEPAEAAELRVHSNPGKLSERAILVPDRNGNGSASASASASANAEANANANASASASVCVSASASGDASGSDSGSGNGNGNGKW